jgi:hypothetical protein
MVIGLLTLMLEWQTGGFSSNESLLGLIGGGELAGALVLWFFVLRRPKW